MMNLQSITERRNEYEILWEPLKAKVLTKFLTKPSKIGTWIHNLRNIDLSDSSDREIFLKSVRNDVDNIISETSFTEKETIEAIYQEWLNLLINEVIPCDCTE